MPRQKPLARRKNRSAYVENRLREIREAKKAERQRIAIETANAGKKRCNCCLAPKPASAFHSDVCTLDGLGYTCIQCKKLRKSNAS